MVRRLSEKAVTYAGLSCGVLEGHIGSATGWQTDLHCELASVFYRADWINLKHYFGGKKMGSQRWNGSV
jgi:hypothetical protein